uniref:Putative secreted protein n=1 Tax=Ixodes ricinus TaxID=34613 RepID=A0A6B0UEG0_IXORI
MGGRRPWFSGGGCAPWACCLGICRFVQCGPCYKRGGRVCIGRIGGCLDDGLGGRGCSLGAAVGGRLLVHCRTWTTRQVTETFHIVNYGAQCVGKPSMALSEKEIIFFD